jgi:hypothetical protein
MLPLAPKSAPAKREPLPPPPPPPPPKPPPSFKEEKKEEEEEEEEEEGDESGREERGNWRYQEHWRPTGKKGKGRFGNRGGDPILNAWHKRRVSASHAGPEQLSAFLKNDPKPEKGLR